MSSFATQSFKDKAISMPEITDADIEEFLQGVKGSVGAAFWAPSNPSANNAMNKQCNGGGVSVPTSLLFLQKGTLFTSAYVPTDWPSSIQAWIRLFNQFGTHALTKSHYGGRAEMYFSMVETESYSYSQFKQDAEASCEKVFFFYFFVFFFLFFIHLFFCSLDGPFSVQEGLNKDSVSTDFTSSRKRDQMVVSGAHTPTQQTLIQLRDSSEISQAEQSQILQDWSASLADPVHFPSSIEPYRSEYRPLDLLLSGSSEYPQYWSQSYRKALSFFSTLNAFRGANGYTVLTDFYECAKTTGQAALDCFRRGQNCGNFGSRDDAEKAYDEFVVLRPQLESLINSWSQDSISELANQINGLV
jgi:hypothetical protein